MTLGRFALEQSVASRVSDMHDLGYMFGQAVTGAPIGGSGPVSGADPMQPVMPQSAVMPPGIQAAILQGESGGDFDALYGHSQREGGRFAGVRPSAMTLNQWIDFTNPSGEYGQWVAARNNGVVSTPMGGHQIVGSNLGPAKEALGLTGDELMTPQLQQQIADWIYKTQGPGAWEALKKQGPLAQYEASIASPGAATRGPLPPFIPEQAEPPLGMFDAIKSAIRGEKPAEIDIASGLQALGVGLGQMSHGAPIDTSGVIDRRDRRSALMRAEYKEQRAREAAAQYAYEAGDASAAEAIMSGGMDLGTFLDERQRKVVNERAAVEDRRRAVGQQVIFDAVLERGGSLEDAQIAAYSPETYFRLEELERLDDEIADKTAADQALRQWAIDRYSGIEGADAQSIVAAAQDPNVPMDSVFEFFDLDRSAAQAEIDRAQLAVSQQNADTATRQAEVAERASAREDQELADEAVVNSALGNAATAAGYPDELATAIGRGAPVTDVSRLYEGIETRRETEEASRLNSALADVARSANLPDAVVNAIEVGVNPKDITEITQEERDALQVIRDRMANAAAAVALEDAGANPAEVLAANEGLPVDDVLAIQKSRLDLGDRAREEAAREAIAASMRQIGLDDNVVRAVELGTEVADAMRTQDEARIQEAERARDATISTIEAGFLDEDFPHAQKAGLLMAVSPTLDLKSALEIAEDKAPDFPATWDLYAAEKRARGEEPNYEEYTMLNNPSRFNAQGMGSYDRVFGEALAEWDSGKRITFQHNLERIGEAKRLLESGAVESGAVTGAILKSEGYRLLAAFVLPGESLDVHDLVGSVMQQSLREILGGQFASAENQQLIDRAYNPQLPPERNLERVDRLHREIGSMIAARDALSNEFRTAGGTMKDIDVHSVTDAAVTEALDRIISEEDAKDMLRTPEAFGLKNPEDMTLDEIEREAQRLGIEVPQ